MTGLPGAAFPANPTPACPGGYQAGAGWIRSRQPAHFLNVGSRHLVDPAVGRAVARADGVRVRGDPDAAVVGRGEAELRLRPRKLTAGRRLRAEVLGPRDRPGIQPTPARRHPDLAHIA